MPRPERLTEEACRERSLEIFRKHWQAQRPIREAARKADVGAAFAEIGELSHREVLIAGAIAYWCEGTKNRPYRRIDRVTFINSDPALICFFMRFLAVAGISRDRLICRLHIHESADVDAAQRFWLDVTGLKPEQFARPTLKRHNPRTVRKNTGDDYHGCLRIDVRRSAGLYRRIEGWVGAALTSGGGKDGGEEAAC